MSTNNTSHILFVILVISTCLVSYTIASSASEPAFQSQLRSCFEPNRNTHCYQNQGRWSSCGHSIFSSYQHAVSTSLNCMRSVCGRGNGLCCNTYCSMFGLSGGDHSNCFTQCFNGPSHSGANLDKPARNDDDGGNREYVECSVQCAVAFSFYKNSASKTHQKPTEFKSFTKFVKNLKAGKPIKKKITKSAKSKSAKVLSSARNVSRKSYFTSIKPRILLDGRKFKRVLRTSIQKAIPSSLVSSDFFNSKVPKNQICASSMKDTVKVSLLKSTGIQCAKLSQFIKNDKSIAPENLENVYNFMLVLHQKCEALPKSNCVMPSVEYIKLTK